MFAYFLLLRMLVIVLIMGITNTANIVATVTTKTLQIRLDWLNG